MKPTPKGWPRITAAVFCQDAPRAIDFLCRAFGFEVQVRVDGEDGRVEHSQLAYGDGLVMVGSLRKDGGRPGDLRPRPRILGRPWLRGGGPRGSPLVVHPACPWIAGDLGAQGAGRPAPSTGRPAASQPSMPAGMTFRFP
jgi:catechol 2,3-dioxygenase-like lactoylglutathione lyase family enzyme